MGKHLFSCLIFCILFQDIGIELDCFPSSQWGCEWFTVFSQGLFGLWVSLGVTHVTTSNSVPLGCPSHLLSGKLYIQGHPSYPGFGLWKAELWHTLTSLIISLSERGKALLRPWAGERGEGRGLHLSAGWAVQGDGGSSHSLLSSGSHLMEHLLAHPQAGFVPIQDTTCCLLLIFRSTFDEKWGFLLILLPRKWCDSHRARSRFPTDPHVWVSASPKKSGRTTPAFCK